MIGSVLINLLNLGVDVVFTVDKNSIRKYRHSTRSFDLYTLDVEVGDVIDVTFFYDTNTNDIDSSFFRKDYTIISDEGNMGIVDNNISVTTLTGSTFTQYSFVVETVSDAYNFEYRLDLNLNPQFIIEVDTSLLGITSTNQIMLPIQGTDMIIDWGDGNVATYTQPNTPNNTIGGDNIVHTYTSPDVYTIKIGLGLETIRFANGGDCRKLTKIKQWGSINWTSFFNSFNGCINMIGTFTDSPDLTNVTTMNTMFGRTTLFNSPIGDWDVSNVTNMGAMFVLATSFNQPIGNWDVSNVTAMTGMFQQATSFNQPIGNWDVSNVNGFLSFMAGKTDTDYSSTNLDAIYNGWSQLTLQPNLTITFNTIKYTSAGQAGKDILTGAPNNWTITDGGI